MSCSKFKFSVSLISRRYFSVSSIQGGKYIKKVEERINLKHLEEFGPILKANVYKSYKPKTNKIILTKNKLEEEASVTSNNVIIDSTESNNTKVTPIFNDSRSPSLVPLQENIAGIMKLPYEYCPSSPSVSKILSTTMSEESKAVLARWEKEKIALLGLEGFQKFKTAMFSRGKTLHSILENFLETRKLPEVSDLEDDVSKRHLVSISQIVAGIDRPLAIESAITHPDLGYSGIADCVAVINNTVTLIDWKTSEKVKTSKESLFDNPLQLAAYIGAINSDPKYEMVGSIRQGAVVVVYNSGYPAMVHTFNQTQLEYYWLLWCQRLKQYKCL